MKTAADIQKILTARGLRIAAQAIPLPKELKEWIHLMPVGHWEEFRGGGPGYGEPMDITAEHIAQMAANFAAYLNPVLFDYEHESCWGNTRAAGWIVEVAAKEDGLWGRVEWTAKAQEEILGGEYRYCSPMWDFNYQDPKSGERVGARLHSTALTNTPFFEQGLEQKLAAKEMVMDELKQIAAALGLAETATLEEILAAITKLKEAAPAAASAKAANEMLTAMRNELRVPATATTEELLAAIKARGEGEGKLAARMQEMETEQRKAKGAGLVARYQAEGKLVAADLPWAKEQAEKDPVNFEKLMASAPVKVDLTKGGKPPKMPVDGEAVPTEMEIKIAKASGADPKQIAAQRQKREQAQG